MQLTPSMTNEKPSDVTDLHLVTSDTGGSQNSILNRCHIIFMNRVDVLFSTLLPTNHVNDVFKHN